MSVSVPEADLASGETRSAKCQTATLRIDAERRILGVSSNRRQITRPRCARCVRDRPPSTRGGNRWRCRMKPQERLTLLGTRIRKYDIGEDELLRELGNLQPAFDGVEREADYREKIDAAVGWGKIYLNPLKSEKYSGGREQVRGFLLQDLASAAKIAGDIM